ncbi:MAG: TonB-dependent receptor plug domain-containing protein, partial [Burkholderiaceae bacterium]
MFVLTPMASAVAALAAAGALLVSPGARADMLLAQASLKEVVVSGSRSERVLADVPASVDVLSGEDLNPTLVQDIRDMVRDLPNVSVKRAPQRFGGVNTSTGRDGNAGFNIRGLEGNRVLLTVDGIRMPREMVSGTLGSAAFGRDYFDLGLISRVEILRGGNSALYGSDGLAGMVAMFTTQPADILTGQQTVGGRVLASYTSEDGMKRAGATVAGRPNDTVQWLIGGTAARS